MVKSFKIFEHFNPSEMTTFVDGMNQTFDAYEKGLIPNNDYTEQDIEGYVVPLIRGQGKAAGENRR